MFPQATPWWTSDAAQEGTFRGWSVPVSASGRVVGVGLTDAMLPEARHRVERAGRANIDLMESGMDNYEFPGNMGGVLSAFAMTMVDDYDGVIRRAAEALRPGGRLAILEMKRPEDGT